MGSMSAAPIDRKVRGVLSPSRAGDFMSCPLLFRYRTIDRLPEGSSPDAAQPLLEAGRARSTQVAVAARPAELGVAAQVERPAHEAEQALALGGGGEAGRERAQLAFDLVDVAEPGHAARKAPGTDSWCGLSTGPPWGGAG